MALKVKICPPSSRRYVGTSARLASPFIPTINREAFWRKRVTQKINVICSILFLLLLASLIGCATTSELICGPIETEILSDPEGAKIEIDNKYIGTTPLTVTLHRECDWYNYRGAIKEIIIKAEPLNPGQFTQYKIIAKSDILPRRINFYMYQKTSLLKNNKD